MKTTDTRSRAVLARDATLTRLSRTRRWVIAGAAALTAGFAALVSAVAPGRSLASKTPVRTPASDTTASSSVVPRLPPPADPSTLGLQGPSGSPQSIPSQPQSSSPPQQNPSPPSTPAPAPQSVPASPPSGGVVSGGS